MPELCCGLAYIPYYKGIVMWLLGKAMLMHNACIIKINITCFNLYAIFLHDHTCS